MDDTAPTGRPRRRTIRRILLGLAALLALALALALALPFVALRVPAVRLAILERLAATLETGRGIRLEVGDIRLRLLDAAIEAERVSLADARTPEQPFLTADVVAARVSVRSLFGPRVLVRTLRARGVRLDLGASRPERRYEPESPERRGVDVLRLEVEDVAVFGARVAPGAAAWLDSWRLERIAAAGEWVERGLELRIEGGRALVESALRPTVAAEIEGTVTWSGDGTIAFEDVRAQGPGLAVEARGSRPADPEEPWRTAIRARAEIGRVLPDVASAGQLDAQAELRLHLDSSAATRIEGSIDARIAGAPARALVRWAPALGALDLEQASADGAARFELDAASPQPGAGTERDFRLAGKGTLSLRRGREVLVALDARTVDLTPPSPHPDLEIEARVVPALPGHRRVAARVEAPAWSALLDSRFVADGTVEATQLRRAFERLRVPSGRLGSFAPGDEIVDAEIAIEARSRPATIGVTGTWRRSDERVLAWRAQTSTETFPPRPTTPLAIDFEAQLFPDLEGRRAALGLLRLSGYASWDAAVLDSTRLYVDTAELSALAARLDAHLSAAGGASPLASLGAWRTVLEGRVDVVADLAGPLARPDVRLGGEWWPAAGERVVFDGHGRVGDSGRIVDGPAALAIRAEAFDVSRLPLGTSAERVRGRVSGTLEARGEPDAFTARVSATATDVAWGTTTLPRLALEAETEGDAIAVRSVSGEAVRRGALRVGGAFRGSGVVDRAWPPRRVELEFELAAPIERVGRTTGQARLAEGVVYLQPLVIELAGGAARFDLELPLGAVGPLPGPFARLPQPDGPLRVRVRELELGSLLALVVPERPLPDLSAKIAGTIELDPRDPLAATGAFEVSEFEAGPERRPLLAAEVLRVDLGSRLVRLSTTSGAAVIGGTSAFAVAGAAHLAERWQLGDDPTKMVEQLRLTASGTIDASVLGPYLHGGLASGPLDAAFEVEGSLDALEAELRASGASAVLLYPAPYPTKFEAPEFVVRARRGATSEVLIEHASATLNGGDFELTGRLATNEGLVLEAIFAGVHYRLDYGASAQLRGALQLVWPQEGRRRLSGDLVVERATLRRRVELDREILRVLFEPERQGADTSLLETIDLDIDLTTDDGLRIRNNLADLHADWGRLDVDGTLAAPLVTGSVDIVPGGRLFLIGQTLRVDEGALSWTSAPPSAPRLRLDTTSSLDDPTIAQSWRGDWAPLGGEGPGRGGGLDFANQGRIESAEAWESMASGALVHFQDRVAGTVGQLTTTHISYEPLPLFGETDTQARYTIAQDLSAHLSFIASSNPREAEAQTYILDVHAVPAAPSLRSQFFRNDADHIGATIQQTVRLGPGATTEERGPRIRRIVVTAPKPIGARMVRRASGFRKGQAFPPGSRLDVEIDVAEALRRKGWPASRVDVSVPPVDDEHVELHIEVDPGPRVSFDFEGEDLPSATRRAIAALYRPEELIEELSRIEVREETERALRAQGHLDPQVEVTVEPQPDGGRNVRVTMRGGRRVDPGPPVIEGLPEADARAASARITALVTRVELAAGEPRADALLLDAIRSRGYPDPSILARELSADGTRLRVIVDPGPPSKLVRVEVLGVEPEEAQRLAEVADLRIGDVVLAERLATAATRVEDDLRAAGHAEAKVHATSAAVSPERRQDVVVRLVVRPGPVYRIAEVLYEGVETSRPAWVEKTAGLEPGKEYRSEEIAEARGRLYRTGVFQRVAVASEDAELPPATGPLEELDRVVTFDLVEKKRYQVGYGLRWEDEVGLGVVAEFLNRNSLGRGHTSGVRGVYAANEQSLRLYHLIPRVIGPRSGLELFVQGKNEQVEDLDIESIETWAQLTFPLSRRTRNRFYAVFEDRSTTESAPDPDEPLDDRVISPRLGWQIVFDTRELTLQTLRSPGLFLGLDVSGASTSLGSELSVLSLFTQLGLFVPLGRSPFLWASSLRTGSRDAAGTSIPSADRLFVGGEFSVRGYPRDSLGALDAAGNAIGGEVSLILNQELIARLRAGISALVFFDAGNVWATRDAIDWELSKSWGLGLRYQSPIGPLRLDYAVPLDRREGIDPRYKIYFGFGEAF